MLALVLAFDLRSAIGFSSFAVLVYYAIANTAALTLHDPNRRRSSLIAILGLAGCLTLTATLPTASALTGVTVLLLGLVGRALINQLGHRRP